MEKTIGKSILVSIILLLIGIGVTVLGFKNINDYNEKKKTYIEVSAKVVDYEYPGMSDEGAYTIYEYTVDGVNYRAKSTVKSTSLPSIGKDKTIMYNPSNPNDVIFIGGSNYIVLVAGFVFAGAGLLLLYRGISLKNKSANIKYDDTNINNVVGPNS